MRASPTLGASAPTAPARAGQPWGWRGDTPSASEESRGGHCAAQSLCAGHGDYVRLRCIPAPPDAIVTVVGATRRTSDYTPATKRIQECPAADSRTGGPCAGGGDA